MLTPKKLRFSGIGPFIEEQVIDFSNLANLAQILGESGSGKSTMFNAMDFLFGISDLPNTVLETYIQKMPLSVSCEFDFDGLPLTITRAKNKLTIDLNGDVTTGSNKLAEEKLDQIIGMPRALFRPMLHKRQKEGGFFLNFSPKEKYEFLTSALGLGEYQSKLEKVEAMISLVAKDLERTENYLKAQQTGLAATQDAISSLGESPVQEVTQEAVLALKQVAERSAEQLKLLQLGHNTQLSILEQERPALQRPETLVMPFDGNPLRVLEDKKRQLELSIGTLRQVETKRIEEVQQKLDDLRDEKLRIDHLIRLADDARASAHTTATEIKKIREGICATCEQPWVHDSAKTRVASLMANISIFKNQIMQADEVRVRRSSIDSDIEAATLLKIESDRYRKGITDLGRDLVALQIDIDEERQKMSAHQQTQANENRALMTAYDQELAQANAVFRTKQEALSHSQRWESNALREQAESDRKALEAAVSKMQAFVEAKRRFDGSNSKLQKQEQEYTQQVANYQDQNSALAKKALILEEVRRAVKSYVSSKFDDALASVADAATTMIRMIPNMVNATIQLDGTKETKDGKVKEEVNAVIHKDGFENVHIKSLSGGQRSSVDIAIDLAVIDFLEERTNKGISLFVMDEPFVGIPTAGIEQILEMLQNYKSDKQIIISDHNPIIEEFIQSKIYVSKNGPTSLISLI